MNYDNWHIKLSGLLSKFHVPLNILLLFCSHFHFKNVILLSFQFLTAYLNIWTNIIVKIKWHLCDVSQLKVLHFDIKIYLPFFILDKSCHSNFKFNRPGFGKGDEEMVWLCLFFSRYWCLANYKRILKLLLGHLKKYYPMHKYILE